MTRIGSLCTGYGGLDMAVAEVLGGTVAWHAEIDPAPAEVLAHHHPDVPNLGDLTTVDWATVEPVDVLTAGYPCQPFSTAGQRKGTSDDRHLWPDIRRAVRYLRPRIIVLENVAGHLSLGLGRVLGDLAEARYDAGWTSIRASDVGAPHGRLRVFVVATNTDSERCDGLAVDHCREASGLNGHRRNDADRLGVDTDWGRYTPAITRWEAILGRAAPQPLRPGTRQLNAPFVEWMMGLPAGWVTDILPNRKALRVLGNGVVPQQATEALRQLGLHQTHP